MREQDSQNRLDQMQAYMDNLAKLLEGTAAQPSQGPEITVKLVPLNEKDDVRGIISHVRKDNGSPQHFRGQMAQYLTSQLTG